MSTTTSTLGSVNIDLKQFEDAAIKYRGPLLKMPVLALQELLRYMTSRMGVRGTEVVGSAAINAQLAPYKAGVRSKADLDITPRALTTYFGAANLDFEPNSAISTVLGHKASQGMGDAQITTPTALEVLSLIASQVGEGLRDAIFNGVRNENGTTTADLFDGFITIIRKEITGEKISESLGNLKKIGKVISANAVDKLKDALRSMDPRLRSQECFLFCPVEVADNYNDAYLMTHTGLVYNDKYEQVTVEGSNKRLTIVPVPELAGSDIMFITPKENVLVGMDQLSDAETVRVKEYDPDVLTMMMRLFFGVQFHSIDKRKLLVVDISEAANSEGSTSGTESDPTSGTESDPTSGTESDPTSGTQGQ